jgi:hypothetical protein
VLDLSLNTLSGVVPYTLGRNTSQLDYLDLSHNGRLVGDCWPFPNLDLSHCDVGGVSFLCRCDIQQMCNQGQCRASQARISASGDSTIGTMRSRERVREDHGPRVIPIKSDNWKVRKQL